MLSILKTSLLIGILYVTKIPMKVEVFFQGGFHSSTTGSNKVSLSGDDIVNKISVDCYKPTFHPFHSISLCDFDILAPGTDEVFV